MSNTRRLPRLLLVFALLLSGCAKALGITPVPTRADFPALPADSYSDADALLVVANHFGRLPGSPYFAYEQTVGGGEGSYGRFVWVLVVLDPAMTSYAVEQRVVTLNLSYRRIIAPGSSAPDGARGYLEGERVLGEHLRATLPVSAAGTTCPPAEWGHFMLLPESFLIQMKVFRQPAGGCGYTLDGQPLRGTLALVGYNATGGGIAALPRAEQLQRVVRLLGASGTPQPRPHVRAITVGGNHTCALMDTGGVKCWGRNAEGQLGIGPTDSLNESRRYGPTDVVGLTHGVRAVAAGERHTCALLDTGGVKCWGRNQYGQLGSELKPTEMQSNIPVDMSGLAGIQAIAPGYDHVCALTDEGGVKCWGRNQYGQLGDGTTTDRHTPVDVTGLTRGVRAITAGYDHTCALLDTGGVKCWGSNGQDTADVGRYGQVGDGTSINRLKPVQVVGLTSGVRAIAAGSDRSCALMASDGLKCWGQNTHPAIVMDTSYSTPVTIEGLMSGVRDVVVGSQVCVVMVTGALKCGLYTPTDVPSFSRGVSSVAIGPFHICVLLEDGAMQCGGDNRDGELGNGTNIDGGPVDVNWNLIQ